VIVKVTINSVDVSAYVRMETILITSTKGKQITTCEFTMDNPSGVTMVEMLDVQVTNAAGSVKYFAGLLATYDVTIEGITKVYTCQCQDYSLLLSTAYWGQNYLAKTDAYIIADAFTNALPEISTTGITESTASLATFTMNHISLKKMMETLAELKGMEWYVDYDKLLHYYAPEENYAAYSLSTSPDNVTSFPFYDFLYSKDGTNLANRVTVYGGWYKTDDKTTEWPANGVQTEFGDLPAYTMAPSTNPTRILVWKNTGSDVSPVWTAQIVGVDNIDTLGVGGVTVLFNAVTCHLTFQVAPANLTLAYRVQYRYRAQVAQTVRSMASYTQYGKWFDLPIVNADIQSDEEAENIGRKIINEQAFGKHVITLKTMQSGFEAGQLVWFVHGILSIARYLTISKVKVRVMRSTYVEYEITMAGSNPNDDIIDNLVKLNEPKSYAWTEDEIIRQLFDLSEDSIALTETAPTTTATVGPYYTLEVTGDHSPIKAGFWKCSA